MSYDLHVYCVEPVAPSVLAAVVAGIDGLRFGLDEGGRALASVIEHAVRGKHENLATLDGPLHIEAEDLPDSVRAAAVGIGVTYQLACSATPASAVRQINEVARGLAKEGRGVVYDPQEDAVTWPRGSARKFSASKERLIEVVDLKWFVRRTDRPDDLPGRVLDTIQAILPEASPRRFGGYEPLQFKLDEEGRSGFGREWLADGSLGIFWKAKSPCFGGSTSGLGAPSTSPAPPPRPVGSVKLSFHREALSDARWRRDVVRLFLAMTERTNAFFALSDVEGNVGCGNGNLWYSGEAKTPPGVVVRDEWLGLPPHEFWLAWVGPPYRDLVAGALPSGLTAEPVGKGLFLRTGEEPPHAVGEPRASRPPLAVFPAELVLRVEPARADTFAWNTQRTRAARVPDGL